MPFLRADRSVSDGLRKPFWGFSAAVPDIFRRFPTARGCGFSGPDTVFAGGGGRFEAVRGVLPAGCGVFCRSGLAGFGCRLPMIARKRKGYPVAGFPCMIINVKGNGRTAGKELGGVRTEAARRGVFCRSGPAGFGCRPPVIAQKRKGFSAAGFPCIIIKSKEMGVRAAGKRTGLADERFAGIDVFMA